MSALVASPHSQFPFHQDNGSKKPIDTTDNGSSKTIEKLQDPHSYENRLKTFVNWQNTLVRKEELAAAGFMFTGHDDIVVCPACKIEGYRWQAGDDPMADHRIWSPNCPFIRSSSIEHDHSESTSRAVDTCGIFGVKVLPNSHPEDQKSSLINELSIPTGKGPHNPDKVTFDSRLASFKNWPRSIKQRPADLAEAGFYYTGAGDQTLCFSCGGGLKDWDEDDDPWEQHAIWFSKCAYLGLKKGKDFIVETKQKLVPPVAVAGSSGIQSAKESEKSISTDNLSDKCEKVKLESDRETKATTDTPLCKICFKNELGVVFLPCGHIVACVDCAAALKACAVCRKPLEATVRAFLS